eukprot:scaffold1741_cov262-Pinguiococcus_pyrenoidosus.AAC.10
MLCARLPSLWAHDKTPHNRISLGHPPLELLRMASLTELRAKRSRVEELEQQLASKAGAIVTSFRPRPPWSAPHHGVSVAVEELEAKVCAAKEQLARAKRAVELPERVRELEKVSKAKDERISELLGKIRALQSWDESGSIPSGPKFRMQVTGLRGLKSEAANGGRMVRLLFQSAAVVRLRAADSATGVQAPLEVSSKTQSVKMAPLHAARSSLERGGEVQLGVEDAQGSFSLIGVALVSVKTLARRPGAVWLQLSSHLPKHVCDVEVNFTAVDENGQEAAADLPPLNGGRSESGKQVQANSRKPAAYMSGPPKVNSKVLPYKKYDQPLPLPRRSRLPRQFP